MYTDNLLFCGFLGPVKLLMQNSVVVGHMFHICLDMVWPGALRAGKVIHTQSIVSSSPNKPLSFQCNQFAIKWMTGFMGELGKMVS